jgi:hypothetical protein
MRSKRSTYFRHRHIIQDKAKNLDFKNEENYNLTSLKNFLNEIIILIDNAIDKNNKKRIKL